MSDGSLTIISEDIVLDIPRGQELLRLTKVEARANHREVSWYSLRLLYRAGVEWKPGRNGLTIRLTEMRALSTAFDEATRGGTATPGVTPKTPGEGEPPC